MTAAEPAGIAGSSPLWGERVRAWLPIVVNVAWVFAVLMGCAGFAGWLFQLPLLRTVLHGLPDMAPNTAAGFVLAGLALWGLRKKDGCGKFSWRTGQTCALALAMLGLVTVSEYVFGWDARLDHWLFSQSAAQHQAAFPGRPAILTSVNFALLGMALLLLDARTRRGGKPAELCTVTAVLISLLGLIGHVCGVPSFYGWKTLFANEGMALSTVTGFVVFGAGVLCARPAGGLMEIVTSRTASGSMARRLLLAPVFIPLATGWMRLMGGRVGVYNNEFGGWLFSFGNIFVFTLFIWMSARLLFRAESMRRRAEEDLQALNLKLEQRVHGRTVELSQTMQALHESERRVRGVLDTALDAVITADDKGRIISWNREAERIFGWNQEDILGRNLSTIIPPAHRAAHEAGLKRFAETREGPVLNKRIEITALNRDGSEFPVELAITPIRLGETFIFSAFVRDITQRKLSQARLQEALDTVHQLNGQLESRVRERTAQLEESNKELEAFSYSVSHDLRAPLRHIAGFVSVLREDLHPEIAENSRHSLDVITDSAARMGMLIDNLLSFSHVGRAEMRFAQVETDSLMQEVLREVKVETKGREIAWEIGTLPEVFGDRAMLKQVWLNLVSNAIKYTRRREKALICIGAHARTDEVEFFVKDNGAGFNMNYSDKLFGVFQRLHLSEDFEGTGIGLANVRRIVGRHGGRTWAEGQVDAGATFHFTLPNRAQP